MLYVGVTNNLECRIFEHKTKLSPDSYTSKYNINKLIYFEVTNDIYEAIRREKQLKKYNRRWKIELVEKENPEWKDLSEHWEVK